MGNIKIVKASAGSGKTYRLAYEYVKAVVSTPTLYRNILAVTFTNKATEEMKRRIISELNALASAVLTGYMADLVKDLSMTPQEIAAKASVARTRILHDYSRFSILTIDKFFQRIIRSFIKELGIDLNFNLELQTDSILSSATDLLIDDITINEKLKAWIIDFVEEKIEQNRRWDVKSDVSDLGREIFKEEYRKLASYILSKEELSSVVTGIAKKVALEKEAICKIANDALGIMEGHGLEVDDFSSKKSGVAGYIAKTAAGVMAMYGKRVQDALESDDKWVAKTSPKLHQVLAVIPAIRPLLEAICNSMPSYLKQERTIALVRENFRNFALLGDLADRVIRMCDQNNIMPISETNSILNKLISGNDAPFIFEKVGNQFERFMMDEFQDTSAMQWENFLPLLRNAISQTTGSPVLIVGDVKQSIYRWRGGDWQILNSGVEAAFADVEQESLAVNYRSDKHIVEFNNDIITQCIKIDSDRLDQVLAQAQESGFLSRAALSQTTGLMSQAYEGHAQIPASKQEKGYVNLTMYETGDDRDQIAPPVIKRVEQLQRRGYKPGDIAFLVRSNREGEAIASLLLEHKSASKGNRYCYDVVTQEALTIGFSPVVRFVIACFELSINPDNELKQALYNQWMARDLSEKLSVEEAGFLISLRKLSPEEAFEALSIRYGFASATQDVAYLQALHEQIISFGKSNVTDLQLFLKWWKETGTGQSVNISSSGRAMTIITVHKAKGLDFKAVILPYCDWLLDRKPRSIVWVTDDESSSGVGAIPLSYKKDMGLSHFADTYYREMVMSHIDNVNLLYVALTRARNELHIMIPADDQEIEIGKRNTKGRVGGLLLEGLAFVPGNGTSQTKVGNSVGLTRHSKCYRIFEFGSPSRMQTTPPTSATVTVGFRSYMPGNRLKLRFPMTRYIADEGFVPNLMPRDYGVMMHRAFEQAVSVEEVFNNIQKMQSDGLISSQESKKLSEVMTKALLDPVVASWFEDVWDEVRNENDIILPLVDHDVDGLPTSRPDRVMIKGRTAVVVDYKFGLKRDNRYNAQLRRYISILEQMGYDDVSGYIWYVSLESVEKV